MTDELTHYGIPGMRWGQRKSRSEINANARARGLGQKQLKSEAKRIAEAGGGVKGTIRVRREMIKNGELSKEDARKGNIRFG